MCHIGDFSLIVYSKQRYLNRVVLQRRILFGKTFELAFKFIDQDNLNSHTDSSASSSLMKSSALCSLRPSRRACFISSNALSSDSFTLACWRSVFLFDSSLVLNTVVDTTPRSNSVLVACGECPGGPTYYILSRRENYVWGQRHHLRIETRIILRTMVLSDYQSL